MLLRVEGGGGSPSFHWSKHVWAYFSVLVKASFFLWLHTEPGACFFWFPNTIFSNQVLFSETCCGMEPTQTRHTPTVKQSHGFLKRELDSKRLSLRIFHSPLQSLSFFLIYILETGRQHVFWMSQFALVLDNNEMTLALKPTFWLVVAPTDW